MNKITTVRVNLGVEERSCGNCRWKIPHGREWKRANGEETFCRHPTWMSLENDANCGNQEKQEFPDWEPRSRRQVKP